jgi:histidinol-phosphate aminotransferase
LQEYTGADADRIVAANGSGELLDYILCLFIEAGDEVINCVPTFDLYRFRTLVNGGKLVNVPRNKDDFSIDIKAVKEAINPETKIIVLANPNNPTGNLIPREDILELADTGVPLLVDEAYVEFSSESVVPLTERYNNLMVLRTFSKWPGLAGFRAGYGIFPLEIASYLMKIKLPYNVGLPAMIAVEATFKDMDYLRDKIEAIVKERDRLFDKLNDLEWIKPFPSQANFIYCSVLRGDARELCQKLQDRGILLRYFDQPLVQNGFRISVGRPEHTDILIKALR